MFGRISYTFSLMGASWQVLKKDKSLLLLPLLSGICCLVVMASFAVPIFMTESWQPPAGDAAAAQQVGYYGVLFLFYLCNYFVIIFFNSAVVTCAVLRLQGGAPTIGDGLSAAFSRLPLIFGWALVSATVGVVLRIIEDRSKLIGSIVAGLLGMAWSVITYLAVPVLVVERTGPVETFRRSAAMLKRTWGEQIMGSFGFGVVFFLLAIPGFVIVGLGVASASATGAAIGIVIAALYLMVLALVQSALVAIFQGALYLYALNGAAPADFDQGLLDSAMHAR